MILLAADLKWTVTVLRRRAPQTEIEHNFYAISNINTFLQNNMIILKQIVWGTQNW